MENTVYILVEVTYDHYRFQENWGAYSSIEEAMLVADKEEPTWSVYVYNGGENENLDNREEGHWDIEEYKY